MKKILFSLMGLALIAILVGVGVMAAFSDTETSTGNTFSTGTVDIAISPATAVVTFSGMAPGDVVTAPQTVTNNGTLDLRYAVTSSTTEDTLAAQLDMTIKTGVTTCTNAGFGTDGVVIYGPADLGSIAGVNVVGDPTQGSQVGDRALSSTANEVLCIQVSLPLSTGDAFQSLTTTASLAFASEQTANNP